MARRDGTDWSPSPTQLAVLEAAQGCGLQRNVTVICDEVGVARSTFYRWLDGDADFKKAWEEVWTGTIKRHLPGAIQALAHRAQDGDAPSIKLLAELAGVYRDRKEIGGEITGITVTVLTDTGAAGSE